MCKFGSTDTSAHVVRHLTQKNGFELNYVILTVYSSHQYSMWDLYQQDYHQNI